MLLFGGLAQYLSEPRRSQEFSVGVSCATITSDDARVAEFGLKSDTVNPGKMILRRMEAQVPA